MLKGPSERGNFYQKPRLKCLLSKTSGKLVLIPEGEKILQAKQTVQTHRVHRTSKALRQKEKPRSSRSGHVKPRKRLLKNE